MPEPRVARDLISDFPRADAPVRLQADAEIPVNLLVQHYSAVLRDDSRLAGVTVTQGDRILGQIPSAALLGAENEPACDIDEDILTEVCYFKCPKGHFRKLMYGVPVGGLHCPTCNRLLELESS